MLSLHHTGVIVAAVLATAGTANRSTTTPTPGAIPGYTPISTAISWSGLGVTTSANGIASVGTRGAVYTVSRNSAGKLQYSVTTAAGTSTAEVIGSPRDLTNDAPGATLDEVTGKVLVVVRDAARGVSFAQGTVQPNGTLVWQWNIQLGPHDGPPAVASACGLYHIAARRNGQIWVNTRAAVGGAWRGWTPVLTANGDPSLAVDIVGRVGLVARGAARAVFASRECGGPRAGQWSTPQTLGDKNTNESRVSIISYGPLFGVAIRGADGNPYFLLQQVGAVAASWPGRYELVTTAPRGSLTTVSETPVATTFRGLIFLGARNAGGNTLYWIRNPNSLTPLGRGQQWVGGRTMAGWGTAATPAAFAVGQTYNVGGQNAPADLYTVVRGVNDRQLYLLNLSRFATLDVIEGVYNMVIQTDYRANNIAKQNVGNLFELLAAFLRTPSRMWEGFANLDADSKPTANVACNRAVGKGAYIYPISFGGEFVMSCQQEPGTTYQFRNGMAVNDDGNAWHIWEEMGHEAINYNWSYFNGKAAFAVFGLGVTACRPSPCPSAQACIPASTDGLPTDICAVPDGRGWRPVGFVTEYAATSQDHDWLYVATYYRWFGDELRAMARSDVAMGDNRLQRKYEMMKTWYDDVEFNGTRAFTKGDETAGQFAFPVNK